MDVEFKWSYTKESDVSIGSYQSFVKHNIHHDLLQFLLFITWHGTSIFSLLIDSWSFE